MNPDSPATTAESASHAAAWLGVDGGGTRTRAWLVDESGQLLGQGMSGPGNYHDVGWTGVRKAVEEAVAAARAALPREHPPRARAAFLGLAGITAERERQEAAELARSLQLASPEAIGVHHDIHIALAGGLAGAAGIALIAGTGSSCYGRNDDGETVQVGGWGPLADDAGSAGWIARRGLEQAVREGDGRAPAGLLAPRLLKALGAADLSEFMLATQPSRLTRDRLASLCPDVLGAAREGDAAAERIATEAVQALCELVATAARRLRLEAPEVVLAGGLATSGPPFQPRLEAALRATVPGLRLRPPAHPPVAGAVIEAVRLSGKEPACAFLEHLARASSAHA